jgi:hypothetical protein
MLPEGIQHSESEFEPVVIEREAGVVIDAEATLAELRGFLGRQDEVLAREVAFVREQTAELIVADIPAIAGDIAHETGVPCVGISNFTWDWIFEPYAPDCLSRFEQGYSRMSVLLRLPFYQPARLDVFPRIVDVSLPARKFARKPRNGGPTRVLLGSRAHVSPAALERARTTAPEFEFVTLTNGASFTDALAACDMVVAKLGFSMVAECIAAQKPLLYPPRENFREESVLQQHVGRHLAALPIPLPAFYSGQWSAYLRALAAQPPVDTDIRTDGSDVCAAFIADYLSGVRAL